MKQQLLFIILNLLYVTANNLSGYELVDQLLLKYWSIDDNDNESRCQLDMNRNSVEQQQYRPQPLLIYPNTSKFFQPTERTGVINAKQNERVELFCSTGFSSPTSITGKSVLIRCNRSGQFQLDNDSIHSYFACRKHPTHSARRHSNARCFNNGTLVDIGFEINERFPTVMTLCHDPITEQTYYVHYKLTPANVTPQRNVKRPSFIQGDFFRGKRVEVFYKRENQMKVLREFFSGALDKKDSDLYLSRGHLAAKGDFISSNEQRATFYYINVAPQWQSFNGLNWRAIEDGSRRLAADRNITLNVYTGTHGVITMSNSKGISQDVYLDMVNKQIPVPKIFYKLLIDAKKDVGVAIVCANNVHISIDNIRREYIICDDVSDEIKYIKWRRREIRRGYCYACRVDDFLKKVPHIDGISISKLLL